MKITGPLTDKNAAQVLAVFALSPWSREQFQQSSKPFKFNLGALEQQLKAAAAPKKPAHTSAQPKKGKKR